MGLTHLYANIHHQEIIMDNMCTNAFEGLYFSLRSLMGEFVFVSPYSVMNNVSCLRERNSIRERNFIRECLLPSGASNIATRASSYQY